MPKENNNNTNQDGAMADDDKGDYTVGYGKPPRHTRFPKGQSGNPKGRTKGSLNVATILPRMLLEDGNLQRTQKEEEDKVRSHVAAASQQGSRRQQSIVQTGSTNRSKKGTARASVSLPRSKILGRCRRATWA